MSNYPVDHTKRLDFVRMRAKHRKATLLLYTKLATLNIPHADARNTPQTFYRKERFGP